MWILFLDVLYVRVEHKQLYGGTVSGAFPSGGSMLEPGSDRVLIDTLLIGCENEKLMRQSQGIGNGEETRY